MAEHGELGSGPSGGGNGGGSSDPLYRTLAKVVWLAVGAFVLLWFLDAAMVAVLLFIFALVLTVSLNPVVNFLETRKIPRWAGTVLLGIVLAGMTGLLGWLVAPHLVKQASALAESVPEYATRLQERGARLLADFPAVERQMEGANGAAAERIVPTLQSLLMRVGRFTVTALGVLVFAILLVSTVAYALIQPRPLLKGYIEVFPLHLRDPAARAFAKGSSGVVGWLWSNVVIGGIEGIGAAIFLSVIGVPGAIVWGVLTFFAELIPKLGPYFMAIPPILVALAVDPLDALWVLLFYIAIQQIAGDVIGPMVRAKSMDVHPVSLLFVTVAMAMAFGILGALIATPIIGYIKAFYDEFYLARQPKDDRVDERVEAMLARKEV